MTYKTTTVPYGTAIHAGKGDWIVTCATDDEAREYIDDMEEEESGSENIQQTL